MKTKARCYFSVNFQVQGLFFSLIVYQFEVSLHPREAYTSYISTDNLIIQDSPSKYHKIRLNIPNSCLLPIAPWMTDPSVDHGSGYLVWKLPSTCSICFTPDHRNINNWYTISTGKIVSCKINFIIFSEIVLLNKFKYPERNIVLYDQMWISVIAFVQTGTNIT